MPYPNRFPGVRLEHEIHQMFTDNPNQNWRCRVCGITWKVKPRFGKCIGCRIYEGWNNVPDGLYSKTALYRDHKRKLPDGVLPTAAVRPDKKDVFIPLYALEQGDPDYPGKRNSNKEHKRSK